MLTHLPCHPWCSACVESRRRDDPFTDAEHTKTMTFLPRSLSITDSVGTKLGDVLPVTSFDYGFETGALRARFGMDTCSGGKCAAMMMRKRSGDLYVVRACTEFVLSLGCANTVSQADGEPAMREMRATLRETKNDLRQLIVRISPRSSHTSNGAADGTLQQIRG